MNRRTFAIYGFVLAGLFAAMLFAGAVSTQAAAPPCTPVGTWFGQVDMGATWIDIISPGANATTGQNDMQMIAGLSPTLFGFFPTAVRMTMPRGLWQKVDGHTVKYTWFFYGFDADGTMLYTVRGSGTRTMDDCDHASIVYVMEIFVPGQDVDSDPPFACIPGTGSETRMPLVQAACDQPPG